MMSQEAEKWKLKSDGLVRQMEHMDKAFKERTNTLQVKLSAQGKLTRETLKRNRELEKMIIVREESTNRIIEQKTRLRKVLEEIEMKTHELSPAKVGSFILMINSIARDGLVIETRKDKNEHHSN